MQSRAQLPIVAVHPAGHLGIMTLCAPAIPGGLPQPGLMPCLAAPIPLPDEPAPLEAPLMDPVPPFAPEATEPVVDPVPLASPLLIPELVAPELAPVDPVPVPVSPDIAPVAPGPVDPEPPVPVVPAPLPAPMEAPELVPLGRGLSLLQAAAKRRVDQQIAQTKARGFMLFPRARQTEL